jgi:hypothetical protein
MEQSSKIINTYDVFMDEVKMENEPLQELEENASVQTKINRNPKNNEDKLEFVLKKLHAQDYFGNQIGELHYVWHFTMLMITKKLIL